MFFFFPPVKIRKSDSKGLKVDPSRVFLHPSRHPELDLFLTEVVFYEAVFVSSSRGRAGKCDVMKVELKTMILTNGLTKRLVYD